MWLGLICSSYKCFSGLFSARKRPSRRIFLNPDISSSLSPGDGVPHHVAGAGWLLPRGVGAPHRRLQPGQLPGLLHRGVARGHCLAEAAQHGAHHLLPVQHGHGHPDLLRHPALPAEVGCSALSTWFLILCLKIPSSSRTSSRTGEGVHVCSYIAEKRLGTSGPGR